GTTDGQSTALIETDGTTTRAALLATIAGALEDLPAPRIERLSLAGETIQSRLENGAGSVVLAVMGDSTGNDTHEWPRLSSAALAALYPNVRVEDRIWNHATLSYDAATVYHP